MYTFHILSSFAVDHNNIDSHILSIACSGHCMSLYM